MYLKRRSTASTARAAIESSDLIHPIKAPPTLDHRYLNEDVGWGLVPWIWLGEAAGCRTPTMAAVTQLAGVLNGVDYTRVGSTTEAMGLEGMSVGEITAAVARPSIKKSRQSRGVAVVPARR